MLNDHTTIRSTAVFDLVGPPNPPVPVQVVVISQFCVPG